jgi:hypothetical protein
MFGSASHLLKDDEATASARPAVEVDPMAQAASAILACGEYLSEAPEMPSDQRAAVEVLRQEIRTLVCGLRLLTAAKAGAHRIE